MPIDLRRKKGPIDQKIYLSSPSIHPSLNVKGKDFMSMCEEVQAALNVKI